MKTHHLLTALMFSTAAYAADPYKVSDLRISAGIGKLNGYDVDYTYTEGPNSYFASSSASSSEAPENLRVFRASYTGGRLQENGGVLWGIGIQHLTADDKFGGMTFDARATGLQGRLMYGFPLGEIAHLEIGPFLGTGIINVDEADLTANSEIDRDTGEGWYFQAGLEAGVYVALGGRFVIGVFVSADYTSATWEAEFANSGGSLDADADWSTLLGGASVGLRF